MVSAVTLLGSPVPSYFSLSPGIRTSRPTCFFRAPSPTGCCTFVSDVTVTVTVASSSVSTVRLFPERRVITPLPFTLSEAWANPKLKRHTARRLTEIPILLLVIDFLSILMRRFARANAIEGEQGHGTGKSDRRNKHSRGS